MARPVRAVCVPVETRDYFNRIRVTLKRTFNLHFVRILDIMSSRCFISYCIFTAYGGKYATRAGYYFRHSAA